MNLNFFKSIYNEDIIYHYTKASTAIDYIFYKEELKFGKKHDSIDPIESRNPDRSIASTENNLDEKNCKNFHNEANELENIVSNLESSFYQICFCKNEMGYGFAGENYNTRFQDHEEIFGFTKPRMWERYANNYLGVCIAFSKKKILEINSTKFNLKTRDVEYLKYKELFCSKVGNISVNHLSKVGFEEYKEQLEKQVESSLFCKHIDYSGENEFRIGVYHQKDNCIAEEFRGELHFNKSMRLNIKGCIKAIFISSFANDKQKKTVLKYAEDFNVPIIEIVWNHDSFEPIAYKKSFELSQKFND